MAIARLVELDKVKFVVSQNIDGLHLRSGLSRDKISELHGNMFIDSCNTCKSMCVRSSASTSGNLKMCSKAHSWMSTKLNSSFMLHFSKTRREAVLTPMPNESECLPAYNYLCKYSFFIQYTPKLTIGINKKTTQSALYFGF